MKHPLQNIVADRSGRYLYASAKNTLVVFDLQAHKIAGLWRDELDNSDFVKKKYEEKFGQQDDSGDQKRVKANAGTKQPLKVPKVPTPGPGAPPIYNYIRALRLSEDEKTLFATTDSDKAAAVFAIDHSQDNCLALQKRQTFAKRPCALFVDEDRLVVADKFGDVYSLSVEGPPQNEKDLKPILGHVSMLSDVVIVEHQQKKYILTGDRDEHIRVSHYPQAFVITNFLFGHQEFVSCLHVPLFAPELLFSGGGDDFVCLWRWFDGVLVAKVDLREAIAPFLTDAHFPPERFLTESSPKEIAVVRICSFTSKSGTKKSNKNHILVLCEQTKAVLHFEFVDALLVKLVQTLSYDSNVLDMSYVEATGTLLTVHDKEDGSLQLRTLEDNTFDEPKRMEVASLSPVEVKGRTDFLPLYYVNNLRKRSEH